MVVDIDATEQRGLIYQHQVEQIPHFVMALDGRAWQVDTGATSERDLVGWFWKAVKEWSKRHKLKKKGE